MKILVTGAAGFIGSHLVPHLRAEGHDVDTVDRAHPPADWNDLALPGTAETAVEDFKPDYVIHLAARYGRILCRDEPHRAVTDNAAATTELAAACAERDIPVLYASSSEVYGDHGFATIYEDSDLEMPTTIYGLSKRWGEEALRLYLPPENLTIARLNMLYGPNQRAGYGCCALATFIRDALAGEALTVHKGTSRSWLYIGDAVTALSSLIGRPGIWNVGNAHEPESIPVTAQRVIDEVGDGELDLVPAPPGQIAHKMYDTSKLEKLGWKPVVSLREGIAETVEAARQNGLRDYQGETWQSATAQKTPS
jgi:nucleoside-diphosphate-sugar epimerase